MSSFLLVYVVVPACMALTAAHWLVVRSARSGRRVRWLGLHWLTWLAGCAAGGPFFHYSIVAAKHHEYGWPWGYYSVDGFSRTWCFHCLALVGDLAIWLTVLPSTAFVVEQWTRRVEQRAFLQKRAFLVLLLVIAAMIWIASNHRIDEWYEYSAWLFGLAATVCTFIVSKAVPKISLLVGIVAGAPFWFVLSPLVRQEPQLVAGLSLVAGAFAAIAVDACCRILTHHNKDTLRFVDPACGEHVAGFPMWAIGIVGIIGGLALIYVA